jgi:hypothetical protein
MIKANQDKEIPAATLSYTPQALEQAMGYLMFPVDVKGREMRAKSENLRNYVRNDKDQIEYLTRQLVEYTDNLGKHEKELAQIDAQLPEEHKPTIEQAQAAMEAASKLSWIQDLNIEGYSVKLITNPGILKTQLRTRIVDFGGGLMRTEFLAEPVMVPLPQIEMFVNLQNMGNGRWANNTGAMAVRMIEKKDVTTFIGGKVVGHDPRAHWAAGTRGFREWSALCLGEYEKDLTEASKKGLADLLIAIASYLQTAGDEHAYLPKAQWALAMGNPAYNPHVYRLAEKDETTEQVDAKYKRDYKIVNAIEFPEGVKVNPGANGDMIIIDEAGEEMAEPFTIEHRPIRFRPGRGLGALMTDGFAYTVAANVQDTMAAPEPMDGCLCDNDPEDPMGCMCDGDCPCHEGFHDEDD